MWSAQDFWEFLKKQQERIALLVPLVALIVGIVNSLLDKAQPPVLNLRVFTVLVVAYCIWTIIATEKTDGGAGAEPATRRRYSIPKTVAFNLAAIAVLAGAWGFVYREHLRYSRLADG